MATWKDRISGAIRNAAERQETLVANVQRGVTLSGETLEKVSAYQLALAADGADAAVTQVKMLGQPGTAANYLKSQLEFTVDGVKGVRTRASELGGIVNECAKDFAALVDIVPRASAARSRKAA
jgi:hypothetical protein